MLSGLFVAVITSLVTVRLALWQFHSEKWWERKAEVYTRLIEALYDMHCYHSEWLRDYESSDPGGDPESERRRAERRSETASRHKIAEQEVQKIAVIGAFVVSDAVAADLLEMQTQHGAAMSAYCDGALYDVVADCMTAVEKCLTSVREHAKQDLGIKRNLPPLVEILAPPAVSLVTKIIR
jgi:hypothetical protein